jgi:hypothetical protein
MIWQMVIYYDTSANTSIIILRLFAKQEYVNNLYYLCISVMCTDIISHKLNIISVLSE